MIDNIHLNNFRSYKELKVDLSEDINVFIGKNGQGKTNLLESIYYISNIRSHRSRDDKTLIMTNEDFSRIIVNLKFNDKKEKLMCVIHSQGKYFSINNNVVSKTSDILGQLNTVLFYPNETRLFNDSPATRRNFFDVEIGKVSKDYTMIFQEFNNLLKDRNRLLKEENIDDILLDVINDKLIDKQLYIIQERKFLTGFINDNLNNYLNRLSSESLNIEMQYVSTLNNLNKEQLKIKYKNNLDRDKFNRITNEGIHRDDYLFYTEGVEISKYLSQGQTRLTLLGIKFVLIQYIISKTKRKPILLLDDVLSELDEIHQIKLIENIPADVQTIITSTDNHKVFDKKNITKYIINNSEIVKKEDFDVW